MTKSLVLSAVGDIMLGDLPACSGFGVGSMIAEHGPRFPFEKCRAALQESDVVLGNLEVVLSRFDPDTDPFGSIHLRAQPEAVDGLAWAGINAVNLANNHIMQHGSAAVHETIELLRRNGIAFTGIADTDAGIQNLSIMERKGVRLGLLGYNFRPEQYKQSARIDVVGHGDSICSDIEEIRNSVDFLILSLHWGEEFIRRPSAQQVKLGRRFIDAGAHVLLGHHPHVVQGIEKYRGRIIAYSLGDFVFDLWPEHLRKSMILRLFLNDPTDIEYEIVPVLINRNWQPELLSGAAADIGKREIEALAGLIEENFDEAVRNVEVEEQLEIFRRSVWNHYLANIHRFNTRRLLANFVGMIERRLWN